jgi:hypothetical protein
MEMTSNSDSNARRMSKEDNDVVVDDPVIGWV